MHDAGTSARRVGTRLLTSLLVLLGLFLIGRAVVEIITLDPTRPESYRHDWGGPHYLVVMLVHAGPGAVALAVALALNRRRRTAIHRRVENLTNQVPGRH